MSNDTTIGELLNHAFVSVVYTKLMPANVLTFLLHDALQCKARYYNRMSSVRPSVCPSIRL